jgi:DNA-binding response OmpR family regulator
VLPHEPSYPRCVATVLIVEDDDRIGSRLETALAANGHDVYWQRTGHSGLTCAEENSIDLVLLDLGLPDSDGFEISRQLRRTRPDSVIVVLTARRDEMDVVAGLESGADDYLFKPFRMTELLARVRAHLRRAEPRDTVDPVKHVNDLRLDHASRQTFVAGREMRLRVKEFDLLARLLASVGEAVPRETLMSDVWDEHWHGPTKTLDVHIAAIRRRLAEAARQIEPPARIPAITTVRGYGYRLDPQGSGPASDSRDTSSTNRLH